MAKTMQRLVSGAAVGLVSLGLAAAAITTPAAAATNPETLSIYLDAPFIQGSYVAAAGGPGTAWTNFNDPLAAGNCSYGQPAGVTITGACRVDPVAGHGGATADANVDTATAGEPGSNFPTTTYGIDPIVISLASDARYLGMWWSAGSETNTLAFYRDDKLLMSMTTQDIIDLLGSPPADATDWATRNTDDPANTVTSIGEGANQSTYREMWYFGNPRGFGSTAPTAQATLTPAQPFVYLHMFVGGGLTFDRVELSGGGFEFDNLVVSSSAQTPDPRLVLVSVTAANHTVAFDGNADVVQGTMEPQLATSTTALALNTFSRFGYTFTGWNTEADGTGIAYADGADFDFASDITLFAQWTADAGGGGGNGGGGNNGGSGGDGGNGGSDAGGSGTLAETGFDAGRFDATGLIVVSGAIFVAGIAIVLAPSSRRRTRARASTPRPS